ncbi:MAG TPA: hypothetical protein VE378_06510 [Nitrososphaeraceae archaeon]|nr:hypothetical protein [Nitrososphaeraceae archaeon]
MITPSLKQEEEYEEESVSGVPVCGSNFNTPVVDQAYYTGEIHYRIGDRMYIENAD